MTYKALLIGVSEYQQLPRLVAPEGEVAFLHDVLVSLQGAPFAPNDIVSLQSPTRSEAHAALLDVLTRANGDDTVLIYFAGHAAADRGQFYLLLADADARVEGGSLPASTVSSALERTRASSVLFVLNTSFAGSFILPDSPRLKDALTSYYFIGSVGPTEQVPDMNPFAEAFASELKRWIALAGDLTPEDLFGFVSDRLRPEGVLPFYAARGLKGGQPHKRVTAHRRSIFVSYAHKDEPWLNKLRPHLDSLVQDVAEITYWDDQRIRPGQNWQEEIRKRLTAAQAAVLLVSADFLASQFIRNEELPTLLSQVENQRTRLYCLIIRPCRFDKVPVLSRFQAVNGPDKTLSEMRLAAQERTFLRLTDQLEQALR